MNALRVAMAEDVFAEEKKTRTSRMKTRLYFVRLTVNLVVLAVLAGCGFLIYEIATLKISNDDPFLALLIEFLPSITITALNFIVPKVFKLLAGWEHLSATFEIKMTLFRTVLLRLASLLILIITLLASQSNKSNQSKKSEDEPAVGRCWETAIGQEFYQLCIFDAAVTISLALLVKLPIALIFQQCTLSKSSPFVSLAHPEFDLASSTLNLIYGQAICWMGLIYSPLLSVVTAVKFFISYYVQYFSLIVYTASPSRLYGGSSSSALFMNVLLITLITCVLPLGYHITFIEPSDYCGPYRGTSTVWTTISKELEKLGPGMELLNFLGSAGFLVPFIMVLLGLLYYYWAKSNAQRDLAAALREQLVLEGQDKQFLISQLVVPPKKTRGNMK